jgi:hypothetical protein
MCIVYGEAFLREFVGFCCMQALQQFGTDFELIQNLFPGRTRRQVKAKFKNEEKLHPVRLADALGRKTQGLYRCCIFQQLALYPSKSGMYWYMLLAS